MQKHPHVCRCGPEIFGRIRWDRNTGSIVIVRPGHSLSVGAHGVRPIVEEGNLSLNAGRPE